MGYDEAELFIEQLQAVGQTLNTKTLDTADQRRQLHVATRASRVAPG